jgi:hypothetical protein
MQNADEKGMSHYPGWSAEVLKSLATRPPFSIAAYEMPLRCCSTQTTRLLDEGGSDAFVHQDSISV